MRYIGDTEREFVGFGVFKPGDKTEYNETLFLTGYFEKIESGDK